MRLQPTVRAATLEDAPRLADLAGQLGYPVEAEEVRARLPAIQADPDAELLVAVADGRPVGWIHVELKRSLLASPGAQVMGLVVAGEHRGRGVGATLLDHAERWAAVRGCQHVLVGTRITRERAHEFYRRHGYRLLKTSHFFEKQLT
ncbi:MAG TPA: GNAT family N-acetyltransferase [Candidatus Limnocylindrales bacterium]|nr:GNAT family N-acetyltransferase [Candidatus Limnocylindrales bacterium]